MEKKEAMKILKDFHDKSALFSVRTALDTIIPELKESESEDERMKKIISDILLIDNDDIREILNLNNVLMQDVSAWLEKQGESDEERAKIFLIDKGYPIDANGTFPTYKEMYDIIREGLEKQDEHSDRIVEIAKSAKQRVIIAESHGDANVDWDARSLQDVKMLLECGLKYINREIEKQGEQEEPQVYVIADGDIITYSEIDGYKVVEPKFHEGDWIACEELNTAKIINIVDDKYEVEFIDGNKGFPHIDYIDRNFHLWTIQDANDGDVFYLQKDGKEHIIIYKGVIKERFRTFVSAYCAYNGIVEDFCFADVSRYVDIAYGGIMPATKEQRDLLFQKMKEAGYKWDAEKKESKKKEQKPAEWSEEDEKFFKTALWHISYSISNGESTDIHCDTTEWFKSLKDRVNSKSQQEWSDEDYNEIETIACHLDNIGNECMAEVLRNIRDKYYHTIPQNTWKPSKEQMDVLLNKVTAWTKGCPKQIVLESLYNDLKKLKG